MILQGSRLLGRRAQLVSPKNGRLLGPTFDGDGNVISDTDLENGAVTSYTYNARNELVQTTGPYPDPQHPISPTSSSESGTWLDDTITVTVPHVTEYATPVTPDGTGGGVGYRITYTTYTEDTATHYASGTGSSHAWSFSGLTEGQQYEFQVSLPDAGSGDITTNASFSYINGSDSSASIGTYDEALAARADYTTHDGTTATTWQGMVVFTAAGENASFELDSGDGHTLIPDVQLQKARPVTTYAYNLDGTLASETDPLGNTTAWTYDADGNEASMTLPDPATGENTSEVHGAVTDYAYDLVGNLTSTTYPSPTGVEDSYVTTTSTYDQANNLESTTDANGNVTTFAHNAVGDTLSLTDSDGNTTSWTYDRDGQQTSQSELVALGYYPDGTVQTAVATSYDFYDPAGNLTTTVDSDSRSITYTFDHLSEEKSEAWTDAAGGAAGGVAYSYDAAGYMTSASNGTGSSTTNVADYSYGYTTTGNVQTENINLAGLGTTAVTLAADYDYNNNRTTLAANIGGGTPEFDYSTETGTPTGRFTGFSGGTNDFKDTFSYNSLGDMTDIVQTDQPTGTYNDVTDKHVAMSYDADERVNGIDMYQSSGTSSLVAAAGYKYNGDSELTDLTYNSLADGTGTVLAGYHWDYNAAGAVSDMYSRNDSNATTPNTTFTGTGSNWGKATYSYGPTAQLLGASYSSDFANPPSTDAGKTYDPNGNRTSVAPVTGTATTTGADNRLLFDGTYTFRYDAEGNRVMQWVNNSGSPEAAPQSGDTDITVYTWNNANQLVGATHYANYSDYTAETPVPDWTVAYGNDPFGRMVSRSSSVTVDDVTTTTDENFIYDGQNVALILDDSGAVMERELGGPAVDQYFASEAGLANIKGLDANTVNWLLADNQGTIRDVVRLVSGTPTLENHLTYAAFGNLTGQTSTAAGDAPTFYTNGTYLDPLTGLNKMDARWASLVDAVFASKDPIGFNSGTTNLSGYVGNSPTNFTDPSGMNAEAEEGREDDLDELDPEGRLDPFERFALEMRRRRKQELMREGKSPYEEMEPTPENAAWRNMDPYSEGEGPGGELSAPAGPPGEDYTLPSNIQPPARFSGPNYTYNRPPDESYGPKPWVPGTPTGEISSGAASGTSDEIPVEDAVEDAASRPYSHRNDNTKIEAGRKFQSQQRENILNANRTRNGGKLMSDDPNDPWFGKELKGPGPRRYAGDTVPPNEAKVDHIIPHWAEWKTTWNQ